MDFKPSDLQKRRVAVEGTEVQIVSYRAGTKFACKVENLDPGVVIARASGATRDEAEGAAVEAARHTLQLQSSLAAMKRTTDALGKGKS